MNKDHNYGGVVANQLATLEHIGLFDRKLPAAAGEAAELVDYRDAKADLERSRPRLSARQLQPLPSQMGRRQRRVPADLPPCR